MRARLRLRRDLLPPFDSLTAALKRIPFLRATEHRRKLSLRAQFKDNNATNKIAILFDEIVPQIGRNVYKILKSAVFFVQLLAARSSLLNWPAP